MDMLTIQKNLDRIKAMQNAERDKSFNAIIYGAPKVGKTSILDTCVKPVFIHSFDPGGTKVLQKGIDAGDIIVDSRFEVDDPHKPYCYETWKKEMDALISGKFFDHVGTFVLDSFTTWAQVIMYEVIKRAALKSGGKRTAGSTPQQQDWLQQMNEIEIWMRKFTTLPCNCIALGHDDLPTNEDGAPIDDRRLMITGKLSKRVPALFDEIYYMLVTDSVKNIRMLQTVSKNRVQAGSRLGFGKKLDDFEPPDIKALMKKVGLDTADKPSFRGDT